LSNRLDSFSQEELLGRPSPPLELIGAEERIAGRRVAITGAAGSVGGPLTRRLAQLDPAELLLVDHHEHTLFQLQQEMGREGKVPIRWALADVRDRRKMDRLFREARPEVVFHLAAYKHVPLGESNPDQTVDVNLEGLRAVIESAAEAGASRFVYPSSDKAVDPPSVYGGTKRIAEALTLAANSLFPMGLSVSRFVNIVGTRGSVIELLAAQVAAGNPLGLTNPGMTRYWITMPEALRLLLQTAAAPEPGIVMMADTPSPIGLVDLARHLHRLLCEPGGECLIQYIGARPGERMHEILLSHTERAEATPYPGLVQVRSSRGDYPPYEELSRQVDLLLEIASAGQLSSLRGRVLDLANTLQ